MKINSKKTLWQEQKKNLTGYKKFMTDEEINKLLAFVNKLSDQKKIIFFLLIFVGLRVIEVVSLKRQDIMGNKITFRQAKNKRLHTRIIPNYIKDLLYAYMGKYQDKFIDNYIFPPKNNRSKNKHIQTSSIRWDLLKFRREYNLNDSYYTNKRGVGLNRISVHTIRHYFLTQFYEKSGNDLMLCSEVIGHKKIDVTADYIKAWKRTEREEAIVNQMIFPGVTADCIKLQNNDYQEDKKFVDVDIGEEIWQLIENLGREDFIGLSVQQRTFIILQEWFTKNLK